MAHGALVHKSTVFFTPTDDLNDPETLTIVLQHGLSILNSYFFEPEDRYRGIYTLFLDDPASKFPQISISEGTAELLPEDDIAYFEATDKLLGSDFISNVLSAEMVTYLNEKKQKYNPLILARYDEHKLLSDLIEEYPELVKDLMFDEDNFYGFRFFSYAGGALDNANAYLHDGEDIVRNTLDDAASERLFAALKDVFADGVWNVLFAGLSDEEIAQAKIMVDYLDTNPDGRMFLKDYNGTSSSGESKLFTIFRVWKLNRLAITDLEVLMTYDSFDEIATESSRMFLDRLVILDSKRNTSVNIVELPLSRGIIAECLEDHSAYGRFVEKFRAVNGYIL